jgi:hypothetical protein
MACSKKKMSKPSCETGQKRALASTTLRPTVQAALTVGRYNKEFGDVPLEGLVEDLGRQCDMAMDGDLARTEAMLVAQAHTLDAIFNHLARRAAGCEYLNQLEVQLRLALKAQNQCRATIETLATMKNPRAIAFVGQANIAHGPQQVNNPLAKDPCSRKVESEQDKLVEQRDGQRLDQETASAAIDTNQALETVGIFHRSEDVCR